MYDVGLIACIFAAALLYASVGHGGGSGYLAVMALFSIAPESMRPAALCLNILVASIGAFRFYRAGAFSWSLFWPFAAASVPCAFLGGTITLPTTLYRQAVGVVLLFAAYRLFRKPVSDTSRPVEIPVALACGAAIGLLSGLTGVGGGIFLSPLLLLTGWADTKSTCGVSAAFILVNSIAGLLGLMTKGAILPAMLPYWTIAAVAGGLIGAELGSKRLASPTLRRLLAIVLIIAAVKMIFTWGPGGFTTSAGSSNQRAEFPASGRCVALNLNANANRPSANPSFRSERTKSQMKCARRGTQYARIQHISCTMERAKYFLRLRRSSLATSRYSFRLRGEFTS